MIRDLIPEKVIGWYHLVFAYAGTVVCRFPSKKLFVIGVTGTKGKSTTSELVRTLLAANGHKVALASTVQFKIGEESEPNLFKMTMPGRAYLQKFLRKAVDAGCTHAVIEMTSEGARQFRHKGIELDALIFTNLQPEHIESHGSMEAYAKAKLKLAQHLEDSPKRPRFIVANVDDKYGKDFLNIDVEHHLPFSLMDAQPYTVDDTSVRFVYKGGTLFTAPMPGLFNLKNILAAITLCDALGIPHTTMRKALEHVPAVAGRAESVECGQDFRVVVDYAHTPDSLQALLETYKGKDIICVMGSTGGGRDQWKRPEMGRIADELASNAILTNEDPYDENPNKIVNEIASGFTIHKPHIILDRREAIAAAFKMAQKGSVVLITGKGTDPYIMGPRGSKQPWSDKKVAEEELGILLKNA
ncbi:UDP-N-acetylmuramoyl-L-alanyl-D-glutamate--2,6-diaminopimelate ligase [Patescibacteria group bacterium]|nr:UDP-N-acetylmuramoyl-L-alanyl-D-glutamate--2,6-diaminopimelate ligase [Patescibacteria group bacterium]